MNPLKANVLASVVLAAIVAGIAALLGSGIWWLFGVLFAGLAFCVIAAVQIGGEA